MGCERGKCNICIAPPPRHCEEGRFLSRRGNLWYPRRIGNPKKRDCFGSQNEPRNDIKGKSGGLQRRFLVDGLPPLVIARSLHPPQLSLRGAHATSICHCEEGRFLSRRGNLRYLGTVHTPCHCEEGRLSLRRSNLWYPS